MNNIVLYAHNGSGNHGCEALVRSTANLVKDISPAIRVVSSRPHEDERYIDDPALSFVICGHDLNLLQKVFARALKTLTGSLYLYHRTEMKAIVCDTYDSLCLSIGGDNYCYSDSNRYGRMNGYLVSHGNKTVLWGCSIEPDLLADHGLIEDLKRYSLITARESITYSAILDAGLTNVSFCPDTAFLLTAAPVALPEVFKRDTVGINVSPMVLGFENSSGAVMDNYRTLIDYILSQTNMNIALIPHVVWDINDDLKPLKELYKVYAASGRVALVDEEKKLNCMELKYIISKCRFVVTARTHASIAAYSTCVPTLVTGYSVKAKGIARDIFGRYDDYVCPVQELKSNDALLHAFQYIMQNEAGIRATLQSYNAGISGYYDDAKSKLNTLLNG